MQDYHPNLYSTKTLYHLFICIFLIHSSSLQKMLTALFELVWNTQKLHGQIVLGTKQRCFLIMKR